MLKQVSIYAENNKGAMQDILQILTDESINILGSVTNDSAEYGIIRMVVSDPEKAKKALADAGYLVRLTDVLGIELPDTPGSLNRMLKVIREINVSVNYIYLAFNRDNAMPILIVHTNDIRIVEKSLLARNYILH